MQLLHDSETRTMTLDVETNSRPRLRQLWEGESHEAGSEPVVCIRECLLVSETIATLREIRVASIGIAVGAVIAESRPSIEIEFCRFRAIKFLSTSRPIRRQLMSSHVIHRSTLKPRSDEYTRPL